MSLIAVNLPSLWAIVGNLSVPASQLVASIRSALSLRSFGSGSHHSSSSRIRGALGGGGGVSGANEFATDSQVRIREPSQEQSGEWHRLGQIKSVETDVNTSRISDGTDSDAKRADKYDSAV